MSNENQKTLGWQALEYKYYEKSVGWYVALVSVFILLMAFFIIIESDIFAAVCLGLICVLIIIFSRQVPQQVAIELTDRGIKFGNLFYPYKQIKYFWVVHNAHHQTVNLQTSALINNTVILELDNQDPEAVRNFLLAYLPEHPATEATAAQKVMHRFKF